MFMTPGVTSRTGIISVKYKKDDKKDIANYKSMYYNSQKSTAKNIYTFLYNINTENSVIKGRNLKGHKPPFGLVSTSVIPPRPRLSRASNPCV